MKKVILTLMIFPLALLAFSQDRGAHFKDSKDLKIDKAEVSYLKELDLLVFQIDVAGKAGAATPKPAGQLDGAPVLGYVFPTTLNSTDVGFGETEGIVALAVTSHPDFDDTPLWDEDSDRNYGNDGVIYHAHWVVLVENKSVPGGLAVKEFKMGEKVTLPPTNPGMHMFMDSPGYSIVLQGRQLKVLVPAQRINNRKDFNFDAVSAYMQVNGSDKSKPMLGVYNVYSVMSGNLSLPFTVTQK